MLCIVPVPKLTMCAHAGPSVKWEQFDRECRREGLVFAGSYGELAGKVCNVASTPYAV
jgi:hypothetical protein